LLRIKKAKAAVCKKQDKKAVSLETLTDTRCFLSMHACSVSLPPPPPPICSHYHYLSTAIDMMTSPATKIIKYREAKKTRGARVGG
jgi:hypothetical protein